MSEIIKHEETNVQVVTPMTKELAQVITEDIKTASSVLYILLKRAHDERAWSSLGYNSWGEYIETEFEFSRARSYQLITQAKVIEDINEAAGGEVDIYITEKEARNLKKLLPEITQKIATHHEDGEFDNMSPEDASKLAQDIISQAKYEEYLEDVAREQANADKDIEEIDETVEVGQHYDKPFSDSPGEVSDEDKYYLENLSRMLGIFDMMPEPGSLRDAVQADKATKEHLIESSRRTVKWLDQLLKDIG